MSVAEKQITPVELHKLTQEIYNASRRLEKSSRALYDLAKDKAEKERVYRVKLAEKHLELRQSGYPATLIPDLSRGDKEVAKLKFERDVAEEVYRSAIESKRSIESQLSALQTISKYQTEV